MEKLMLLKYVLAFGIIITIIGIIEFLFTNYVLLFWTKWISNKYYFLHGLLLIFAGYPLTQIQKNPFSKVLFFIGLIFVFTGPFVLIYPEKIQKIFNQSIFEVGFKPIKYAILLDGILKILIGFICILAYIYR